MKNLLRIAGSLVLVTVVAYRIDWHQVGDAFRSLYLPLWLGSIALFLFCQTVSAYRWKMLSRAVGFAGSWGRFLKVYFVGMFFNLALPTSVGGDAVRAWYLATLPHEPGPLGRRTSAVVAVLADRISGLSMLILLAAVGAMICSAALPPWLIGCVLAICAATILGAGGLLILDRLTASLPPSSSPFFGRLRQLVEAFRLYRSQPRLVFSALSLSVGIQVLNAVLVWMISRGLGMEVPLSYFCLIVPLVALLTLVPLSISGMGLREAGYVLLLQPLGIPGAQAVTLSLLSFAAVAVSALPGLGIYLVGRRRDPASTSPSARNSALPLPVSCQAPGLRLQEEPTHDLSIRGNSDQGRAGQPSTAA